MTENKMGADILSGGNGEQIRISADDSLEIIKKELKKAQELAAKKASIAEVKSKATQVKSLLQARLEKSNGKDTTRLLGALDSCNACMSVSEHSDTAHVDMLGHLDDAHHHLSHDIATEHHHHKPPVHGHHTHPPHLCQVLGYGHGNHQLQ